MPCRLTGATVRGALACPHPGVYSRRWPYPAIICSVGAAV